MCLETHVADETKTTTMQFLLEQCLNYIYKQHVFKGRNSFKIAVPFPKFPFNFGRFCPV
jgi:hypothetical protein